MAERVPRFPGVFTLPEDPEALPALLGSRCLACGRLFFPARRFGCPACGADPERVEPRELEARGTLEAFTVVHRSLHPDFPAPYAVGRIALDSGPRVEALLAVDNLVTLRPGARMQALLWPSGTDEAGRECVECRFAASETA